MGLVSSTEPARDIVGALPPPKNYVFKEMFSAECFPAPIQVWGGDCSKSVFLRMLVGGRDPWSVVCTGNSLDHGLAQLSKLIASGPVSRPQWKIQEQ